MMVFLDSIGTEATIVNGKLPTTFSRYRLFALLNHNFDYIQSGAYLLYRHAKFNFVPILIYIVAQSQISIILLQHFLRGQMRLQNCYSKYKDLTEEITS
jgi:hypothetical protein